MRGVSKILATEQDILNNMGIDKQGTKKLLIQLRESRFAWIKVADLEDGDSGVVDEIHKVRVEPVDGSDFMNPNALTKRVQYEYREDSHAQIFRMGLTVEKVNQYIADCDV
jgi:hypothetical protein